jgi:hypothetical protein
MTFEQGFDELVGNHPELYLDVIDRMLWICAERAWPPLLPGELRNPPEDYVDYEVVT